MADGSKIEWTDATWNPITGCSIVSKGCTNCYAMKLAGTRLRHHPSRAGLTRDTKAGPVWTGEVRLNEQWLDQPLRWRRPRRIFVCAHGDLFAEGVPDEWIDRVFAVMALANSLPSLSGLRPSPPLGHTFQVLTKRAERMRAYLSDPETVRRIYELVCDRVVDEDMAVVLIAPGMDERAAPPGPRLHLDTWPLPNVWLGVSAEDQATADERIPELLATPAAVRFVSAEPLLGPVDFRRVCLVPRKPGSIRAGVHLDAFAASFVESRMPYFDRWNDDGTAADGAQRARLDWVIVGGESGPDARPMHPDWARSIRDQCQAAGVAFFFKQWGEWSIAEPVYSPPEQDRVDFWRFTDGDEFHVLSDGHDIIMSEAEDAKAPTKLWREYWADGHGHLAKRLGKAAAGRRLDGCEWSEFPEVGL